jgi:two-component system LytT family response regulator
MKISCIIVEDEPLALERTAGFARRLPYLELRAVFDNAADAEQLLKNEKIDLIFLDINLGGMSGIELLENSTIDSRVIFTTAYQEYALKGYDLQIADYLLKPFTFERFTQAVERVRAGLPKPAAALNLSSSIFVKTGNRLEKVTLREILFIEGMRDYRRIHTTAKRIMTPQTFTEFEEKVPLQILCRVHRSYMVALNKIESVTRDQIQIGGTSIPISDSYKKKFFELIGK